MRAETQNTVDAIDKSLKLLGQRMDRDTAPHRLEEFNAMLEAPDLWNDPARAQKLMRERQGILDAMSTYELISSGLNDNVELIEMGEAEGDTGIVAEAEQALKSMMDLAAGKELEALLNGDKLIPFWRIEGPAGVNIARMFTDPRAIDVAAWIQGEGAVPYLETGDLISPQNLSQFDAMMSGETMLFTLYLN